MRVPLLLTIWSPAAFEQAMSILQPEKISERLHRLHQESKRVATTGVRARVRSTRRNRPGAEAFRRSERARAGAPLASPDGRCAFFSRHQSIVAERVRMSGLMRQVNAFRRGERWLGRRTVEVLVTGRSLTSPRFL